MKISCSICTIEISLQIVVPIIPVLIPLGIDRDFMVNRDSASDITL